MGDLFTLAVNYDLPPHRMCLESLTRHNPTAKIFRSLDEIADLEGGSKFVDKFRHISSVHFSDVFRVWYLLQHGGTWVDADTIHMRPFDIPYEYPKESLCIPYEDHWRAALTQSVMHASIPGNNFLKHLLERQSKLIEDKGPAGLEYLDLGAWSITHLIKQLGTSPYMLPHWEYHYLSWTSKQRFMEQRNWADFQYDRGIYSPNSYCWHLTNAVLDFAKRDSREHLLHCKTFLSFLFIRALTDGFDGAHHRGILEHLPLIHAQYRIVEVGTYLGQNAAILGQQRDNANIFCVDKWKCESSSEYQASGDYLAHADDDAHESHYQEYLRNTWFLQSQERIKTIREASTDAAKRFEDGSLDLVFIDADHSYSGSKQDMEAWYPKVKTGGWLSGHDFEYPGVGDVASAVRDFCSERGLGFELSHGYTWFVRKQA